jgi:hypothetical protein
LCRNCYQKIIKKRKSDEKKAEKEEAKKIKQQEKEEKKQDKPVVKKQKKDDTPEKKEPQEKKESAEKKKKKSQDTPQKNVIVSFNPEDQNYIFSKLSEDFRSGRFGKEDVLLEAKRSLPSGLLGYNINNPTIVNPSIDLLGQLRSAVPSGLFSANAVTNFSASKNALEGIKKNTVKNNSSSSQPSLDMEKLKGVMTSIKKHISELKTLNEAGPIVSGLDTIRQLYTPITEFKDAHSEEVEKFKSVNDIHMRLRKMRMLYDGFIRNPTLELNPDVSKTIKEYGSRQIEDLKPELVDLWKKTNLQMKHTDILAAQLSIAINDETHLLTKYYAALRRVYSGPNDVLAKLEDCLPSKDFVETIKTIDNFKTPILEIESLIQKKFAECMLIIRELIKFKVQLACMDYISRGETINAELNDFITGFKLDSQGQPTSERWIEIGNALSEDKDLQDDIQYFGLEFFNNLQKFGKFTVVATPVKKSQIEEKTNEFHTRLTAVANSAGEYENIVSKLVEVTFLGLCGLSFLCSDENFIRYRIGISDSTIRNFKMAESKDENSFTYSLLHNSELNEYATTSTVDGVQLCIYLQEILQNTDGILLPKYVSLGVSHSTIVYDANIIQRLEPLEDFIQKRPYISLKQAVATYVQIISLFSSIEKSDLDVQDIFNISEEEDSLNLDQHKDVIKLLTRNENVKFLISSATGKVYMWIVNWERCFERKQYKTRASENTIHCLWTLFKLIFNTQRNVLGLLPKSEGIQNLYTILENEVALDSERGITVESLLTHSALDVKSIPDMFYLWIDISSNPFTTNLIKESISKSLEPKSIGAWSIAIDGRIKNLMKGVEYFIFSYTTSTKTGEYYNIEVNK